MIPPKPLTTPAMTSGVQTSRSRESRRRGRRDLHNVEETSECKPIEPNEDGELTNDSFDFLGCLGIVNQIPSTTTPTSYDVSTDDEGKPIQYACNEDVYSTLRANDASYTNVTIQFDYEMQLADELQQLPSDNPLLFYKESIDEAEQAMLWAVAQGVGIVGGDACDGFEDGRYLARKRKLRRRRLGRSDMDDKRDLLEAVESKVVLVSSEGRDVVDTEAPCVRLVPCLAMQGSMTAIITGTDDNSMKLLIKNILLAGMFSGHFSANSTRIANMTFIGQRLEESNAKGELANAAVNTPTVAAASSLENDGGGVTLSGGLFIGGLVLGAIIVILLLFRWRRRTYRDPTRMHKLGDVEGSSTAGLAKDDDDATPPCSPDSVRDSDSDIVVTSQSGSSSEGGSFEDNESYLRDTVRRELFTKQGQFEGRLGTIHAINDEDSEADDSWCQQAHSSPSIELTLSPKDRDEI